MKTRYYSWKLLKVQQCSCKFLKVTWVAEVIERLTIQQNYVKKKYFSWDSFNLSFVKYLMFRHIWRTIIVFFSYPKSQIFAAALILNFAKHNCEFATANVGFAKTIVIIVEQIVICAQHYLWPATGNSCTKVFLLLSMVMLSFCWAIIISIKCT